MGLRMATPWKHPNSGIYWLRRRIPADLVAIIGKKEEKVSLRTRDPAAAKAAFIRAAAEVEARWANLRKGTKRLSHKEAVAIAGEFYRQLVATHEDDPGDPALVLGRLLTDQVAAGSPQVKVIAAGNPDITSRLLARIRDQNRPAVEAYLRNHGEVVDEESFERIVAAVNAAIAQGREQVLRYAQGDYRPDPAADRFPARKALAVEAAEAAKPADYYDLETIYEKFATERKHSMATRKKWSAIIAEVAKVHADIRQISDDWCIEWKDQLLARGLTARSIQYGYLAALRSTCAWAVTNRRISTNPVDGISVKVPKAKKERPKGYSDDEAKFVLGLTLKSVEGRLSEENKVARRWVPWICAYTGARVGEIAQLRKQDIQEKDDIWLFWITPEAGSVKDGNSRHVAIHPHLIEQGFLDFVQEAKVGPLFFSESRKRGGSLKNPTSKKVGERIAKWIRDEGFNDTRVAPNHAWRHRFKTLARRHKIDAGARDYMQGHVPQTEAEEYGEFEPAVLLAEISKLPRYEV
jgi:integrase